MRAFKGRFKRRASALGVLTLVAVLLAGCPAGALARESPWLGSYTVTVERPGGQVEIAHTFVLEYAAGPSLAFDVAFDRSSLRGDRWDLAVTWYPPAGQTLYVTAGVYMATSGPVRGHAVPYVSATYRF